MKKPTKTQIINDFMKWKIKYFNKCWVCLSSEFLSIPTSFNINVNLCQNCYENFIRFDKETVKKEKLKKLIN
jgi:hypothetical protein